jgi:hypothetical protein
MSTTGLSHHGQLQYNFPKQPSHVTSGITTTFFGHHLLLQYDIPKQPTNPTSGITTIFFNRHPPLHFNTPKQLTHLTSSSHLCHMYMSNPPRRQTHYTSATTLLTHRPTIVQVATIRIPAPCATLVAASVAWLASRAMVFLGLVHLLLEKLDSEDAELVELRWVDMEIITDRENV